MNQEDAYISNLFIEIYDDGLVLTPREGILHIEHNFIQVRAGEDAPPLAPSQIMIMVPPRPPTEIPEWLEDLFDA